MQKLYRNWLRLFDEYIEMNIGKKIKDRTKWKSKK